MLRLEGHYERLFGIKTLRIKKSADKDNFHYQGVSYYILLELLKKLPDSVKHKNFIDIGSGKGRALFCAEYLGFNHLIGVELDAELTKTANENIKLYSKKRKESHINFICENALTFTIPDNTSVFYFFNPFSGKIMEGVKNRINDYQSRTKSEIFIMYINPQFSKVWTEAGYEVYHKEGNTRYTEALVFRKKSD